jgi:hypothetical protein
VQAVNKLVGNLCTACINLKANEQHIARVKQQMLLKKQQQQQGRVTDGAGTPAAAAAAAGGGSRAGSGSGCVPGGAGVSGEGMPQPLVGEGGKYASPARFLLEVVAVEFSKEKFPHLAPVLQRLTDMANNVVSVFIKQWTVYMVVLLSVMVFEPYALRVIHLSTGVKHLHSMMHHTH